MVAGEASADTHGAALIRELQPLVPISLWGVGGKNLRSVGMDVVVSNDKLNVVGTTDWLGKAGTIVRSFRTIVKKIKQTPPDLAILIDLPDFNLRLARRLHRMGVPVVYYISPQVWAWRRYRVKQIRRYVDKMLVVFPFEKQFYQQSGVGVSFVGHPLTETIQWNPSHRDQPFIETAPRIGLLPGSRPSEVHYHGPLLKEVMKQFRHWFPMAEFRVPLAPTLERSDLTPYFEESEITTESALDVYRWADAALIASGTATLEASLVGVPTCLFYKVSRMTAWIIKYLVRYKNFVGMPNLLAKKEVIREFLQTNATVENLSGELRKLVVDEAYREHMISELAKIRGVLGEDEASRNAAREVAGILLGGNHGSGFERRSNPPAP